jgi:hypothetical protein
MEPDRGDPSGWVDTIKFIPGYQQRDGGISEPYGYAFNISGKESVFTNWLESYDTQDDMAIIEIDRPVGALAGYLSYAEITDPKRFLTETFYTRGYPGTGAYDGKLMYEMRGTFDDGEFYFSTNPFTGVKTYYWDTPSGTVYEEAQGLLKGFSGSSAYFISMDDDKVARKVTAVASTNVDNLGHVFNIVGCLFWR